MIFWIFSGIVTALALILVLRPLTRPLAVSGEKASVRAQRLFEDQLAELDRDLTQNRLNAEQHAAAKVELQRRFLRDQRLNRKNEADLPRINNPLSGSTLKLIMGSLAVAFPVAAMVLYFHFGSPGTPGLPHAERLALEQQAQQQQAEALAEMEQNLQQQLTDDPANIRNWLLLARLRLETGNIRGSAEAFRGALDNGADDAATHGSYGEMLVAAEQGQVTGEAIEAFRTALERDPNDPRALFYSGLALQQGGLQQEALNLWLKLRTILTIDNPWLEPTDERIRTTAQALELNAVELLAANPAQQPSGPSRADIEAAQSLSAEEQQDMIRGMVERLAERLETAPDDLEGWLRLTQSYLILEEQEKAQESFERVRQIVQEQGQPDQVQDIEALGRQWGLVN
ncbi:c-type cytochrome biogenesis protein CcmI [Kiloniella sp. b19]|uniref:c-type cytochrome biogenesis protein CcmI n=1 Tax=Kiloniella sp. GXU_MW_B19 TaxID=3141326 RepID=UPI0031E2D2B2